MSEYDSLQQGRAVLCRDSTFLPALKHIVNVHGEDAWQVATCIRYFLAKQNVRLKAPDIDTLFRITRACAAYQAADTANVVEVHDEIQIESNARHDAVQPTQTKEETMTTFNNVKLIETKTFINGVDAAIVRDEDIFELIRDRENQIMSLKSIAADSTTLAAKIKSIQAEVQELVTFVDGRNAK